MLINGIDDEFEIILEEDLSQYFEEDFELKDMPLLSSYASTTKRIYVCPSCSKPYKLERYFQKSCERMPARK